MTLTELQNWLKKHKIDAYYITRNNMFINEDILPEENKITKLTGFTGSAGNLIVLQNNAILFIDGRYEIQSKLETDARQVEIKCTNGASPISWLIETFRNKKSRIMYNDWCISAQDFSLLTDKLPNTKFIVDKKGILGSVLSEKKVYIFEQSLEYAGIDKEEKISLILENMIKNNLDGILITAADNVSWLLNIRSNTLLNSPIVRAFALIEKNGTVTLFGEHLNYPNAKSLSELPKILKKFKKNKLGCQFYNSPQKIYNIFSSKEHIRNITDIITLQKAKKNPVELQGIKNAHIRDAVAMVNFLHWLDNNWQNKSELDIVKKLYEYRASQPLFFSNSFETIAGFAENGAIIHYQPKEHTNKLLKNGSMLLLDSGAQYYDGTTDITRTIAIGTPSQQMIEDFTTILKCHIALASTHFPHQTSGQALDSICRRNLWACGKNYNHGTGHGVGCFLNVHEGPQNISSSSSKQALEAGMVNSIEPGYYKEGEYGIRIENLYYISESKRKNDRLPMLKFEYLTLVPIDKRLINKYLLDDGEIKWLNQYHQAVFDSLQNLVDSNIKEWLKDACSPI